MKREAGQRAPARHLLRLADDGVHEIGVHVNPAQHAEEQGRALADREQGDVGSHVAQSVE